jgi:hypothetical protein
MTMDNPTVYRRVLDEGMKHIRNSFLADVPVGKICELLDKGFEPLFQMI